MPGQAVFEKIFADKLREKRRKPREPPSIYGLKNFGEDPPSRDFESIIVNREKEIGGLIDTAMSTSAGNPSNIAIVGPAGIGKSMLAEYFFR